MTGTAAVTGISFHLMDILIPTLSQLAHNSEEGNLVLNEH